MNNPRKEGGCSSPQDASPGGGRRRHRRRRSRRRSGHDQDDTRTSGRRPRRRAAWRGPGRRSSGWPSRTGPLRPPCGRSVAGPAFRSSRHPLRHRLALAAIDAGIDGLRLNPGNIGSAEKVREVVRAAAAARVPIRIGVNSGSLEKDLLARAGGATAAAMVESALRHVRILEDLDFRLIKISLKASDVPRTLEAYRLLAEKSTIPSTPDNGSGTAPGRVGQILGRLGLLLAEGLADTVRVSLTRRPRGRCSSPGRSSKPWDQDARATFVSCPTCGRCESTCFPWRPRSRKRSWRSARL